MLNDDRPKTRPAPKRLHFPMARRFTVDYHAGRPPVAPFHDPYSYAGYGKAAVAPQPSAVEYTRRRSEALQSAIKSLTALDDKVQTLVETRKQQALKQAAPVPAHVPEVQWSQPAPQPAPQWFMGPHGPFQAYPMPSQGPSFPSVSHASYSRALAAAAAGIFRHSNCACAMLSLLQASAPAAPQYPTRMPSPINPYPQHPAAPVQAPQSNVPPKPVMKAKTDSAPHKRVAIREPDDAASMTSSELCDAESRRPSDVSAVQQAPFRNSAGG